VRIGLLVLAVCLGCLRREEPVTRFAIVTIEGEETPLLALRNVEGLELEDHGRKPLGGGRFQLTASATDPAIAELRRRGLDVKVIESAEEMDRRMAEMKKDGG